MVEASLSGFRLYELFRLEGPKELIHYVDVEVHVAHRPEVTWWPEAWIDGEPPYFWRTPLLAPPWFCEHSSVSELHRRWVDSGLVERSVELSCARWADIEIARARISKSDDPLVRFELALIDAGAHDNDRALLEPNSWPNLTRHFRFRARRLFSDADYTLIEAFLAHPAIDAFTHRGRGDWFVIKLACTEQFRRCGGVPCGSECAFPIRALMPGSGRELFDWDRGRRFSLDERPAWTRGVRFQSEGVEFGGVCLDEGGFGGVPIAASEQSCAYDEVPVLLTPRSCRAEPSPRRWFIRDAGLDIGILPAVADTFGPVLQRHGWILTS
ncbi:MAG: hypothetical protein IPO08_09150 [Xanthomonadales bacterium]|nr:hypothetical protein [Xanthomonadales bacterium]